MESTDKTNKKIFAFFIFFHLAKGGIRRRAEKTKNIHIIHGVEDVICELKKSVNTKISTMPSNAATLNINVSFFIITSPCLLVDKIMAF